MEDSPPNVQVYDGDGVDHLATAVNRRVLPGLYAVSAPIDEIEIENGISECASSIFVPGIEEMPTFALFEQRLVVFGGPLLIERLEIVCFRTTYYFDNLAIIDAFWLGAKKRWCLVGDWGSHGVVSA